MEIEIEGSSPQWVKARRIIAVINQKGGVGKTTTATNLAVGLSLEANERVLVVDADGQGNASAALGLKLDFEKDTPLAAILAELGLRPLSDVLQELREKGTLPPPESHLVQTTAENVLLSPADKQFPLFLRGQPAFLFKTFLEEIPVPFDRIIVDCPPSQNEVHNQVLEAADLAIVPCELASFSVDGVNEVVQEIHHALQFRLRREELDFESLCRLLFVQVDTRKKKSPAKAMARLADKSHLFFSTFTRIDDRLNQAQENGISIFHYAPTSNGAGDYRRLTKEILSYEQATLKASR